MVSAPSESAASMTSPVNTTNPPVHDPSSPPTSMAVAETPRPPSTSSGPPYIDPGRNLDPSNSHACPDIQFVQAN